MQPQQIIGGEQGRAGQSRAEQGRAGQSRAEQGRAGQSRTVSCPLPPSVYEFQE